MGLALGLAGPPSHLRAQGLPFHTETALTTAFEQRAVRAFTLYSRRDSASALVTPLVLLPYAPHPRVTTKVALPLVRKRLASPGAGGGTRYSEVGIGDLSVAAKWAFLVRDRAGGTTRLALGADVSIPTGSTSRKFEDGTVAPRPLQPGSGAFGAGVTAIGTLIRGAWGVSADVGRRWNAEGEGFRFGSRTRYDVAIGLRRPAQVETIRTRTWQLYLEWNGAVSGRDVSDGVKVSSSGGHVAFLSPGIQWVPVPRLLVETSLQVPVVQRLNGSQPEFGLGPALGLRYLFF
ncbi:MAG: hypothetical protein ACE5HP_10635 [Gemmatimonadota bacterium]